MQARSEGSFKKGKSPCALGDTPWPVMGSLPSKLQPLSKGQASRTHQIFADVEEILGRAPAHCRTELGYQQGLEKPPQPTEKIYLGFSDPEIEELEMRTRQQKPGSPGPENTGLFQNGQDALKSRSQASVPSKPLESLKGPQLKGEQHSHNMAKRGSTGPGGDKGQSPTPSPSPEVDPMLLARKSKPFLLDSSPAEDQSWQDVSGEGGSVGRSRYRREPLGLWLGQVSKLVHKDSPMGGWKTEPDGPEAPGKAARGPPQGLLLTSPDALASEPAVSTPKGSAPAGSHIREGRPPSGSPEPPEEDRKPGGFEPGLESSRSSSVASQLGSEVLGEVTNFPWDLQGLWGSECSVGHSGPGPREQYPGPSLGPHSSHLQSSAEKQLESEDYPEDQRFYQHILKMVKISKGLGQLESAQEMPCKDLASMVCCLAAESSRMSSEGEHEALGAMDPRFLPWGPELPECPLDVDVAPAGQAASQHACFQPSSSPLRQGLLKMSSSRASQDAEPGKMQLVDQVGFLESMTSRLSARGREGQVELTS